MSEHPSAPLGKLTALPNSLTDGEGARCLPKYPTPAIDPSGFRRQNFTETPLLFVGSSHGANATASEVHGKIVDPNK